jgi:hypothetical protein
MLAVMSQGNCNTTYDEMTTPRNEVSIQGTFPPLEITTTPFSRALLHRYPAMQIRPSRPPPS